MSTKRPLLRLFCAWLIIDLIFLVIGIRWHRFLEIGRFGLPMDLLLGVFVLGQYLRDNEKL